ncbi:Pr6Pr family membrane protein [Sphingosinicella microcystinivorans]|uniref:FAR-17a/AIG1-like protein n=1 Tax=Sphingosinicella microcystinivorans TaxID=335406 RepID=A0AAD1FZP2_SPHMI|nr:Pr6Pr family membrane protein [Sphingosinicella microcystinivorans]RKS88941.1 hypothetical protein DFR51_2154 [Sphingosinicella microcystinivorans]BBE32696.1 hypothetical protein SmB9_03540 [Sphingosinicella microcystinivorans]
MPVARLLALVICLAACVGIGIEFQNLLGKGQSLVGATWALAGYFTILTNAIVAVLFGMIAAAAGRTQRPRTVAGIAAAIALVGVVFALLLEGMRPLGGSVAVSDFLLHRFTPVAVPLYWLLFTRKGVLSWRDPLLWALYPIAYLGYALARGLSGERFAYPFIDVGAIGWMQAAVNAAAIGAGFVVAGQIMVFVDRLLARR